MGIPVWSALTLATELCVTAGVLYIIWTAYRKGVFLRWLAFFMLGYELIFNVSYMASREVNAATAPALDPYLTALAIVHGIFSLVMFMALIVFFIVTWRAYGKGGNFFKAHHFLTMLFVSAWTLSVLSGILLFVQLYL